MTTPNTATVSSGASDSANGGNADTKANFVSAEDFEGFKGFFNKESATRRKELEGLSDQVKQISETLTALAPKSAATDEEKGKGKNLADAETDRRIKTLEETLAQERKEKSDALIATAVSEAISGTNKDAQEVLRGFLKGKARVEKVNGENAVVMDGEDGQPVRVTAESVRKAIGDFWYPAAGKPGSGVKEGGGSAGSPGVDMDRAMKDLDYFEKNKDAILAERARRRQSE